MNKIIISILFLIGGTLISANAISQNNSISYPYIASGERQNFIQENYTKIKINFTENEVKQLLGTPEEILPLYGPKIYEPKKIGYAYWYVLRRLKENGTQNEKNEKIVRISFNLEGKVIAIDNWGLEKNNS